MNETELKEIAKRIYNPQESLPKFVYRFIPVHRLWEIMANNEIVFNRNTKWEDPFEGWFVKKYMELEKDVNFMDYDGYTRLRYFLCCTKDREKDHHWRSWTPNKDGVRLKISVKALKELDNMMICKKIKYIKKNGFLKELNKFRLRSSQIINHLFFWKRDAFVDEREVRFLAA